MDKYIVSFIDAGNCEIVCIELESPSPSKFTTSAAHSVLEEAIYLARKSHAYMVDDDTVKIIIEKVSR